MAPRELSLDETASIVNGNAQATRRAIEVGFDGVELHAASGYLPEQLLSSGSNQRLDQYGGSVEGRARFVLEVLAAMAAQAEADRVGINISPKMNFNSITDAALRGAPSFAAAGAPFSITTGRSTPPFSSTANSIQRNLH